MKVVRPFAFVFALAVALLPALSRAADSLDLHRQVSEPDHRDLLELHPADQHRQRDHCRPRRPGGHRQPAEPRL